MVKKEYFGKVKYLGAYSPTQEFKLATLIIEQEETQCTIKTVLKCNPRQVYRSHVVTRGGPIAHVRCVSSRLIIKSHLINSKEFWELHFVGQQPSNIQGVYQDITKALKEVTSKSAQQSRAEVGLSRKMTVGAIHPDSIPDQDSKAPAPKVYNPLGELPSPIQSSPESSSTSASSSFTSVKTNRRSSQGFLSHDLDQADSSDGEELNDARDGFSLKSPSTRFYGNSAVNLSARPFAEASVKPIERARRRLAHFPDILSSYSWNHRKQVQAVDKEAGPRLGFANLGNTCFMNSILQSLFSLDTFVVDLHYLHKHFSKALPRDSLAYSLGKLMIARQRSQFSSPEKQEFMLRSVKDAISSTAKRFSGSEQHDAQEFLAQVLDQLKEEVIKVTNAERKKVSDVQLKEEDIKVTKAEKDAEDNVGYHHSDLTDTSIKQHFTADCNIDADSKWLSPFGEKKVSQVIGSDRHSDSDRKKGASPADKTSLIDTASVLVNPTLANFEFEVVHSFECTNCHDRVEKAEQFNDLSVDMPVPTSSAMKLSLQDALDMFFEKGEISEYTCEKCGMKKTAELTHRFAKLPRILVLHLKRYSYDGHSRKRLEDIQLPRFLTLQDHCDLNTTPHLFHRLAHPSPTKSPLTPGLMKLPVKTPTENTHRRRRADSINGENGENEPPKQRSPKKVRRSLLPEVGAEAPAIPENQEDNNSTFDDDMEKALEESRKEVSWAIDADSYNSDLQKALELSMREFEAYKKVSDHDYHRNQEDVLTDNNNVTEEAQDFCGNTEGTGEKKVSEMTEDEQLKMAISLSIAAASELTPAQNHISTLDTPPDSTEKAKDCSSAASIFKKPLNVDTRGHLTRVKEAPKKESKDNLETPDEIFCFNSESSTSQSTNQGNKFTKTRDLPSLTKTSPGSGRRFRQSLGSLDNTSDDNLYIETESRFHKGKDVDVSVSSSADQFTQDDIPVQKFVYSSGGRPVGISANIGTMGCFSPSQQKEGIFNMYHSSSSTKTVLAADKKGDTVSNSMASSSVKAEPSHPDDLSTSESKLAPFLSKMFTEDGDCNSITDVSQNAVKKDPSISKELASKAAMQVEVSMDSSDSSLLKDASENPTPEKKKDVKKGREEKENLSPPSSDNLPGSEKSLSARKDKHNRILQHKLRMTTIEKGGCPHSYRLVSIVNHLGSDSGFGHYLCDALDIKKKIWLSYDDKDVVKTTEASVRTKRTSTGYIFFYLSKDIFDDLENMRPSGTGVELAERVCDTL